MRDALRNLNANRRVTHFTSNLHKDFDAFAARIPSTHPVSC